MFYAQSTITGKTRKQHKQAVRKDAVNVTIVWGGGGGAPSTWYVGLGRGGRGEGAGGGGGNSCALVVCGTAPSCVVPEGLLPVFVIVPEVYFLSFVA